MAVDHRQSGRDGVKRVAFGEFSLSGELQTTLTISKRLDSYDFPNHAGASVSVELVVFEDAPNRLEVKPVGESDDE